MSKIADIRARQILDSRGNPTVEVDVTLESGVIGRACVPSGASTGKHEALELRDGDKKRYNGKGVLKAVNNVNKIISKKLIRLDCRNQKNIDELMIKLDGTENKSNLGGNAILAVSMAVCKAGAISKNIPLYKYINEILNLKNEQNKFLMPIPQLNIMNGGKHAGIENDIQEHMIMPVKFNSFNEALRAGVEVYHELGKLLKNKFGSQAILLGDEGGFVPKIDNVEERLELIDEAINNAGYKNKIFLALDCAASEFFYSDYYKIGNHEYSAGQLIDFYKNLVKKLRSAFARYRQASEDKPAWPPIAISTDIIVGFPGETVKQFQNTLKLIKDVKFDMIYFARYSPRNGTIAAKMPDNVPPQEKRRRSQAINSLLKKQALAINKKYLNRDQHGHTGHKNVPGGNRCQQGC